MRDPARELPQAFQPLGLVEPVFQCPAVGFGAVAPGDVAGHGRGTDHRAAGVTDRGQGVGQVNEGVVLVQAPGLGLYPLTCAYSLHEGRQPGEPCGEHQHGYVGADHLLAGVPGDLLGPGVPAGDHAVEGKAHDRINRGLGDDGQPCPCLQLPVGRGDQLVDVPGERRYFRRAGYRHRPGERVRGRGPHPGAQAGDGPGDPPVEHYQPGQGDEDLVIAQLSGRRQGRCRACAREHAPPGRGHYPLPVQPWHAGQVTMVRLSVSTGERRACHRLARPGTGLDGPCQHDRAAGGGDHELKVTGTAQHHGQPGPERLEIEEDSHRPLAWHWRGHHHRLPAGPRVGHRSHQHRALQRGGQPLPTRITGQLPWLQRRTRHGPIASDDVDVPGAERARSAELQRAPASGGSPENLADLRLGG